MKRKKSSWSVDIYINFLLETIARFMISAITLFVMKALKFDDLWGAGIILFIWIFLPMFRFEELRKRIRGRPE